MNLKLFLLALFSLLIAISACNDSEEEEPLPRIGFPLIKTESFYTDGRLSYAITYEYDQFDRLTKETRENGSYILYYYEPHMIIKKFYDHIENTKGRDTLLLNEKGLMDYHDGISYEYDSIGYLVKKIYEGDLSLSFTISDGNAVKVIERGGQDSLFEGLYNVKYLTIANTIGLENIGITWEGKQYKNLQKEINIVTHDSFREYDRTYTYLYEYDVQNRVTKMLYSQYPNAYYTYIYY